MRPSRFRFTTIHLSLALLLAVAVSQAQKIDLPLRPDSLRFAVIGDNGTGAKPEYEVANQMNSFRAKFPFQFVLMLGDNLYGNEGPKDFANKFEKPYKALLDAGVKFYASIGNHDDAALQMAYKPFNMGGKRYYTYKPGANVRFFALDSNYMDKEELEWLERELKNSGSDWKICYFHHPLYSSGAKHGSATELRALIEPIFLRYGVDVVFSGHEHFYERLKPQKGIQYFIVGSSGQLRKDNISPTNMTAKGFDRDNAFLLAEISGDNFSFQVVSRTGTTIDSGTIRRSVTERVTPAK